MSLLEHVDIQAREGLEKVEKEQAKTGKHEARITTLEQRFSGCDLKHESHTQHRRQSDSQMATITGTLNETLSVNRQSQQTLNELLAIVRAHTATVDRSRDSYTTWDGMKSFFIYAAVVSAGIYGIKQISVIFAP